MTLKVTDHGVVGAHRVAADEAAVVRVDLQRQLGQRQVLEVPDLG